MYCKKRLSKAIRVNRNWLCTSRKQRSFMARPCKWPRSPSRTIRGHARNFADQMIMNKMKLSQVYKYGLLAPTLGTEQVNEQIKLAHRYQNKLIEIERAFRDVRDQATDCEAIRALD